MSSKARLAFRNPNNLPFKLCLVCERPFTWRKKWEGCWEEVQTCSKRCNSERKRLHRQSKNREYHTLHSVELGSASGRPVVDTGAFEKVECTVAQSLEEFADKLSVGCENLCQEAKEARKEARKAAKAARRARRQGEDTGGQKACDLCGRGVDLLIRCQVDGSKSWKMVCGRCWKEPTVAGGVVDGDGQNEWYRYGGLWKNLRR